MAATYTVRVTGIAEALAKLTPDLYGPAVAEILAEGALIAERELRATSPRDTAALARSWTSEVRPLSARVYSTLAYARVMEEGRRAGARMPPPAALVGWMGRHGMTGSSFALARAIQRRGIKGRFFVRAAARALRSGMPALVDRAVARIEARWRS